MKSFRLVALLCLALCSASCGNQRRGYDSLTAADFAVAVADSEKQVLDVRTAAEYAKGHLPRAINIDVKGQDFAQNCAARLEKGRRVCIYCRSGRRSKMAANILTDMGFDVCEMDKGIESWTGKLEYGVD